MWKPYLAQEVSGGICVEVYDWNQGPGLRIILLNIGDFLFHDKLME